MSKIKIVDLKVKIDKKSFDLIQNKCFEKSIFWDGSGAIKRQYNEDIFCLYFRAKSNTLNLEYMNIILYVIMLKKLLLMIF